jgi:hypothetical protein
MYVMAKISIVSLLMENAHSPVNKPGLEIVFFLVSLGQNQRQAISLTEQLSTSTLTCT